MLHNQNNNLENILNIFLRKNSNIKLVPELSAERKIRFLRIAGDSASSDSNMSNQFFCSVFFLFF